MSNYEKLWLYLKQNNKEQYKLNFEEIANILGYKINHAFLNAKKEALNYGYEVEKISLKEQTIIFKKI